MRNNQMCCPLCHKRGATAAVHCYGHVLEQLTGMIYCRTSSFPFIRTREYCLSHFVGGAFSCCELGLNSLNSLMGLLSRYRIVTKFLGGER